MDTYSLVPYDSGMEQPPMTPLDSDRELQRKERVEQLKGYFMETMDGAERNRRLEGEALVAGDLAKAALFRGFYDAKMKFVTGTLIPQLKRLDPDGAWERFE